MTRLSYGLTSKENSGHHTGKHTIRSSHELEDDGASAVHVLTYGNIKKVVEKTKETSEVKGVKKAVTIDSLRDDTVEVTEDVPCHDKSASVVVLHDVSAPLRTEIPSNKSINKNH